MAKKLTTKDIIDEALIVYGDKYIYNKTKYVNATLKFIVTCPKHDDFETIKSNFIGKKIGCKLCNGHLKIINTTSLIFESKKKYSNTIDYSRTIYNDARTECIFICKIHNKEYKQTSTKHILSNGCLFCKDKALDTESFIRKVEKINGNIDCSDVVYIKSSLPVILRCKLHNFKYKQKPNTLLNKTNGCLFCVKESKNKTEDNKLKFITKSKELFPGLFLYDKCEYINQNKKVILACIAHGDFECYPNNHLKGVISCTKCRKTTEVKFKETKTWSKDKYLNMCSKKHKGFSNIYLIKLSNEQEEFYKVGITVKKNIRGRYPCTFDSKYKIEEILFIKEKAELIFETENLFLKEFKRNKYKPLKSFDGFSECIKGDINMFVDYIKNKINGSSYEANNYHTKLAKAMI